jgi:hypothetical protein
MISMRERNRGKLLRRRHCGEQTQRKEAEAAIARENYENGDYGE